MGNGNGLMALQAEFYMTIGCHFLSGISLYDRIFDDSSVIKRRRHIVSSY